MKMKSLKTYMLIFVLSFFQTVISQDNISKSLFWENVQFGGGLGLGFGNGFTNISVAPSAIYNFNEYVSAGLGVQYSYISQKNIYSSNLFGGSILTLINPIPEIQISGELEQLRVNSTFKGTSGGFNDSFWNTALFFGAGYRTNNVTIGARYNVLHKDNQGVYTTALQPFVRVYF
jgi:hypothetical protein